VKLRFKQLASNLPQHLRECSESNPIRDLLNCPNPYWLVQKAIQMEGKYIHSPLESVFKGSGSKLACKIKSSCRLKNGMDKCLTIQKSKLRKAAINWRLNKLYHNSECKICNMPFNRNHLGCMDLNVNPVTMLKFTESSERNLMDYLLNNKRYREFEMAMESIKASIKPKQRQNQNQVQQ
jgi:hypothetical protein